MQEHLEDLWMYGTRELEMQLGRYLDWPRSLHNGQLHLSLLIDGRKWGVSLKPTGTNRLNKTAIQDGLAIAQSLILSFGAPKKKGLSYHATHH